MRLKQFERSVYALESLKRTRPILKGRKPRRGLGHTGALSLWGKLEIAWQVSMKTFSISKPYWFRMSGDYRSWYISSEAWFKKEVSRCWD